MPEVNSDLTPVDVPPPAPGPSMEQGQSISPADAGNAIAAWRKKAAAGADGGGEAAAARITETRGRAADGRFAPRNESTAQAEDAAPPQEATGEAEETDPQEIAPLDLPRSWSKDKAEIWSGLTREAQEYILDHDKTASETVRRSQNDASSRSKELDSKIAEADQARRQHEEAANRSLQVLHSTFMRDFADIKTPADLEKLATEDPFRAVQYNARRDALVAQANEVENLRQQREVEQKAKFDMWSNEQDTAFDNKFKEFRDPEKGPKLRESLKSFLVNDIGVPADALPGLWNNSLFRDALMQEVVYNAYRFSEAQKAAAKAVKQGTPPVQRPGTSTGRTDGLGDQIAAARERLSNTRGLANVAAAADLMRLQRQQNARR